MEKFFIDSGKWLIREQDKWICNFIIKFFWVIPGQSFKGHWGASHKRTSMLEAARISRNQLWVVGMPIHERKRLKRKTDYHQMYHLYIEVKDAWQRMKNFFRIYQNEIWMNPLIRPTSCHNRRWKFETSRKGYFNWKFPHK